MNVAIAVVLLILAVAAAERIKDRAAGRRSVGRTGSDDR